MSNHKLDNPKRIEELNPSDTLRRIGLKDSDAFCDVGAGTGIFTFEAAEQTKSDVYAVEISHEMLDILQSKMQERNVKNIILKKSVQDVPSDSCRVVLLCTVLHELRDFEHVIGEVKRIITNNGTLAIIEFHKRQTLMGPPVDSRMSPSQVEERLLQHGFYKTDYFELGENFYGMIFSKSVTLGL
ncbi:class I SAM-dependent methyltransferase [Ethanoligenens sp.]|uniref:class I SAM-dependent methyltransferase n=1 Tax=Ethanoligenens sp. TaxID=2099655 RepID=UPI0039EBA194